MSALLKSTWFAAALGSVLFLTTTTVLTMQEIPKIIAAQEAEDQPEKEAAKTTGASWDFFNPELDQLIQELKQEKESLSSREKQLRDLELRLKSERSEIDEATRSIKKLQAELDKSITKVKEDETGNLKRLAKLYAGMEPAGAAKILKELDDSVIVKVLLFMKNDETAPVLQALSNGGEAELKRAARLAENLRLAASTKNKQP